PLHARGREPRESGRGEVGRGRPRLGYARGMIEASQLWPLVEARARATPSALCAGDERGERMSFEELRARALRGAAALAARGVGPGVRVSWQLPTWIESYVLVAALGRLGAVQNPMLPIYREREVGFIVRQARPRWLVVPKSFRGFDHAQLAARLTA